MKASTKLANVANGNQGVETAPTPAPTSAATTTTTEVKTAPTPEPVRREGLTDNPNLALTLEEIGVSILALGIWLALLATGITVSAQSFIDPIRSGAPIGMDGKGLEGVGVTPDIVVDAKADEFKTADPVLAKALEHLRSQTASQRPAQ